MQHKSSTLLRDDQNGKEIHKRGKHRASLVAQMVKSLPTMRETQVLSLGWGDPLEKAVAEIRRIIIASVENGCRCHD